MLYKIKLASWPLETGLNWRDDPQWICQEKLDGVWHERNFGDSVLVGELVRRWPLGERLPLLCGFDTPIVQSGPCGEFLREVIQRGGEGIVAKKLSRPYGQCWFKVKREETFDCIVKARHEFKRSLSLAQYQDGKIFDCGNVPSLSAKWETIKVGDVVEIRCQERTNSGKFRHPVLVRVRRDKPARDCLASSASII